MAYAGQTLSNPVSGEQITFIRTSADTDGEVLEIELKLTADGAVPGTHVHPEQEERFEVVEGTMGFRMGFKKVIAGPGETVIVPAGTAHRFYNAGDDDARVRVEVRPALRMEQLFETTVALAEDGRVTKKGMPKPLELALFVREFEREVRAPFPPPFAVRAAMAPLAWMAGRRGYGERYAPATPVLRPALSY
jgi:mannose-6-phosphate isomerase-like protein (cupin superfamily)